MTLVRLKRKRPNLKDAEEYLRVGHWGVEKSDYVTPTERRKRLDVLATRLEAIIKEHVSSVRRLDLAILKCHLVTEFMLNEFIDLMAKSEGALDEERFTYRQKELLIHMLGFPLDPLIIPSLDLLNTLRNQAAHTLSINRDLLDKLIRINSDYPEGLGELTDVKRVSELKQITKSICWRMLGTVDALSSLEMQ